MRYLSLLLGFIYLGLLAFVPQSQANSSVNVRYDGQGSHWENDNDRWDEDDNDRWDDEDDTDHPWQYRQGNSDLYRFLAERRTNDRRFDTVVKRYSEPESRLIYDSPLEQYIVSSPFRAARAQLHPYFRNSPLQGYAPAYGFNHPGFRLYANDQAARQALGFAVQPVSPSAVCRNYTLFRYSQRSPGFLESCN